MNFSQAVNSAMCELANHPNTIFVGQSAKFDGAAIYHSLAGVPMEKRLEFPVAENLQLGYCIGLSITGKLPICIYPRMDFMLLCMDQLVNHLDKLPRYGWNPKIIMRCRVGQKTKDGAPMDAGPQHTQNYAKQFRSMCPSILVQEAIHPDSVREAYNIALKESRSCLIVENPNV